MSEKKKEKKNEKMINVGEKPAEDVKMKKVVEKFSKKKENSDTMMFEIVDVKNSNARILMKHHIDDTTSTSNNFTKFFSEFENFLKKESATQAKAQKKKQKKKKEFEEKRGR